MSNEQRPPDFNDTGIREFYDGRPVSVVFDPKAREYVVVTRDERGYDHVGVSLKDVIEWACENMPDLFDKDTRR